MVHVHPREVLFHVTESGKKCWSSNTSVHSPFCLLVVVSVTEMFTEFLLPRFSLHDKVASWVVWTAFSIR
jgi:hypothetical protein